MIENKMIGDLEFVELLGFFGFVGCIVYATDSCNFWHGFSQ